MALLIYRLLKNPSVPPEEMERLDEVCRRILRLLYLVDRDDPLTESIGRKIVKLHRSGVRDAEEITREILKAFAPGKRVANHQSRSRQPMPDGSSDRA
jgi:hypothetical protein